MDFKATLAASKKLHEAFAKREAGHHAVERSVEVIEEGESRILLIFDLAISRGVLKSASFRNLNYFSGALEHAQAAGKDVGLVKRHWDESVLFKEGADHLALKKHFNRLLDEAIADLRGQTPRVHSFFAKRTATIDSMVVFSRLFVRLTIGLILNNLASIPLRRVYQSLALRRNVFCDHFTQSRHIATNAALARLNFDAQCHGKKPDHKERQLLVESLIIMGIDPMVGGLCASSPPKDEGDFGGQVFQTCPTSYVSRTCLEETVISGTRFLPGDTCYLALVPSKEEATSGIYASRGTSIAFGVGVHACIGKRLSLVLFDLAQDVLSQQFPDGFAKRGKLRPDGAFLAFEG